MLQRILAACMAVVSVSGYISLGCRPLPTTTGTARISHPKAPAVELAAATIGPIATVPEVPTTVPPVAPVVRPRASRSIVRPRVIGPVTDDTWAMLSRCEAGGRPGAVSRNGRYYGAFQFSLGTWHGLGMDGTPVDYSYEDQLAVAKRLQARSGWGQWPVCSRHLGLR